MNVTEYTNKRDDKAMLSGGKIAVVDIGSNSIRLVIYDGLKRAPMPLFNEKVLCALARNMAQTGNLHSEGVVRAIKAIGRFIELSKIMEVSDLFLFATAAVRDANDGELFVEQIASLYNHEVVVLSGEDEAYYAGMGVRASFVTPKGVVADLGGGSLELIGVSKQIFSKAMSFPLGPVRLLAEGSVTKSEYKDMIDKYLQQFPFKKLLADKTFYAVGGAFRNLAKVHMGRKSYPLKVLHNYKISTSEFESTLQVVSRMSEAALQRIPNMPSKRVSFLPYAALLASRIIELGKPKNVIFSTYGIREGFLFSKVDKNLQKEDALISGCIDIVKRLHRTEHYGYELYDWMGHLFKGATKSDNRLRLAACILSEISCFENTEYRAELAYRKVMDSSLTGISHKERVFISKALYCRYSTHPDQEILAAMEPLLNENRFQAAQTVGSAMRLARSISCSHAGVLSRTKLTLKRETLLLTFGKDDSALAGEHVEKRLRQLAWVMGSKYHIKVK